MKYQWRKQAEKQMAQEVRYCTYAFGAQVALNFIDSINKQVLLLSSHPHIGKVEPLLVHKKRHEYRSLVVHKHFKLIYYVESACDTIYIVDLWDTRREPAALTNRL